MLQCLFECFNDPAVRILKIKLGDLKRELSILKSSVANIDVLKREVGLSQSPPLTAPTFKVTGQSPNELTPNILGPPNHRHATHFAGQSCNFSSFCRIKILSTQCESARRGIFSGPG
jgi:hypothetical protein